MIEFVQQRLNRPMYSEILLDSGHLRHREVWKDIYVRSLIEFFAKIDIVLVFVPDMIVNK